MLAHEIMTSPVVTATLRMTLKEAIRLLDVHDITALPVVDDRDGLVGIVSEADLLRGALPRDPRSQALPASEYAEPAPKDTAATVADVMTRGVLTAHQSTDASDIARLMLDTGVKSIPVTRGRRVIGIVSRRDLIRTLASDDERIAESIHALFADAGLDDWTVQVVDGHVRLAGHGSTRDARVAAILARTVPGVGDVHEPTDPRRVELPLDAS